MNNIGILIVIACCGSGLISSAFAATSTIRFPDPSSFDSGGYAKEAAGPIRKPVRRDGDATSSATVKYATRDGTAKAGVDYVASSGTITFAPGETNQSISVPIIDNAKVDGDRILSVELSDPTGAALGDRNTVTLYISDNETPVMVDPTFQPTFNGSVDSVLVQSDGRLLIGGSFTNVNGVKRCTIVRLNADGTLDESFDAGCVLKIAASSIVVQPDGKILISGLEHVTFPGGESWNGKTARLQSNGQLDDGFHPDPDLAGQLLLQPDGKILLYDADLIGLNSDGSLDQRVWSGCFDPRLPNGIAVQPDGKVLVGQGCAGAVVRLNLDGSLDSSFHTSIGVTAGPPFLTPSVTMIFVQTNGQIIIGGQFQLVNGVARNMVARLNSDGSLDPSFNVSVFEFGCCYPIGALQSDGKVVMWSFGYDFASPLQRFNTDGSVDPTFQADVYPRVLALQSDGKVIVPGEGGRLLRLFGNAQNLTVFTISPDGDLRPNDFDTSPQVAVAAPGRAVQVDVYRLGETFGTNSVDFTTRDGTAHEGVDYVPRSGTLTFAPLEAVKTVAIPIVENRELNSEKTFSLALKNPGNGGILGLHIESTLTIAPQQFLTIRSTNIAQGGSVRLTLAPTVPGISYGVRGNSSAAFTYESANPTDYFYQDKVATGASLDFEEVGVAVPTQRFYRALRLR